MAGFSMPEGIINFGGKVTDLIYFTRNFGYENPVASQGSSFHKCDLGPAFKSSLPSETHGPFSRSRTHSNQQLAQLFGA